MVLATRECEVVLWTPEEAQARQLAETRRSPVLSKTALPLASNIQLVYNNAKLAAATAVELSKLAKN